MAPQPTLYTRRSKTEHPAEAADTTALEALLEAVTPLLSLLPRSARLFVQLRKKVYRMEPHYTHRPHTLKCNLVYMVNSRPVRDTVRCCQNKPKQSVCHSL